ncbi:MAG: HD domain-containing protein [Chitinispirillia bacterium]|jgi:HD-GYP domain-containing protein (c-di-GMP phosphodiesterase class II)
MLKKKISTSDLKPGIFAEYDYYSENDKLLIGKGTYVSEEILNLLNRRNVFEIYKFITGDEEVNTILNYKLKNLDFLDIDSSDENPLNDYTENNNKKISNILDRKLKNQSIADIPKGTALKTFATQIEVGKRSEKYFREISDAYKDSLKLVQFVFTALLKGKRNCGTQIKEIVTKFVKLFLSDKNILLNISGIKPKGIEHLYCHSLNVCILSINIAASYGYSRDQVIEIGIGALLHDIGMFLIPEEIRHKSVRFSEAEWFEIKKHPILGLNLLEKLSSIPESALYVTYQTHERQNSSGYPKQRGQHLIHNYAKIVQVADIYEALSSPRPHRKESLPYKSLDSIIKMAKINLLSLNTVKAFVNYMSTYPIGSLILLTNRCLAKVVDVNPEFLSKPVVSVLSNSAGNPLAKKEVYQMDLSKNRDTAILKPVPISQFKQFDIMDGF